jgi:PAS domain-containing protein
MSASPFDVVALVSSAGGLSATNQILSRLAAGFGAPVVVVQHLGGPGSNLVDILRRRSPLPVDWIGDHDTLESGRVYVCPPKQLLEIMPDAQCSLCEMEADHRLRLIDFFLTSLADSFGQRALAVVLTGMGWDSAAGCQAVSQAGGTVLVQSPESAEYPGMPSAVIERGVAGLVLPLPEIGPVLGEGAAVEGLLAGADDYIAKPFSARELVARVGGQIALARVRREGQERFRALIDASWDVVYRMSPDWRQMRALDGRGFIADTSSASSNWLETYIHPDDQPQVLEAIQTAIRNKSVFELEHRVRRPDGSLAWTLSRAVPLFGDDGEIVEWVGAAADVTERRRAEQERFQALVEAPAQAGQSRSDGMVT